jgi:hypothetical protein
MKTPKPLVCFYGVPWLWHFQPPIGTGQGCPACDGQAQQLALPNLLFVRRRAYDGTLPCKAGESPCLSDR